eukprot:CAMPEP_0174348036 /NCGR_PEP_ID=MMETSP0811_2-20130205/4343_1 /TAXON_ID=73025 ORGANISM="Eutreptiella gymnastica-like, Strain CCMP1594" /NCGR_SAMPLE_ID=MMETSP0811_2 /ASSEMBLY_ACC=CAM_ASM_000667 /LENGTH=65 /DNA_ID=CAMNT_0015474187 /DNA_START=1025 /DNA_END=1222 /DNA_ORIENTATION=-
MPALAFYRLSHPGAAACPNPSFSPAIPKRYPGGLPNEKAERMWDVGTARTSAKITSSGRRWMNFA